MKRKIIKPNLILAIEDVDKQIEAIVSPSVVSIEMGHALKPLVARKRELVAGAHKVWGGSCKGDGTKPA